MFIIKLNILINLLRNNKIEEAYRYALELLKKYPNKIDILIILAKICFKKRDYERCKKFLFEIISLPNWYKENIVREILELTNWKFLYSNKYFCRDPKFSYNSDKIVFVCVKKDTNNDGLINHYDCGGIYILDLNTGNVDCIVEDKYYNIYPTFSPDDRYVCYFSARVDTNQDRILDFKDSFGLYIFDLKTGEEKLLVDNIYSPKRAVFSPDSKRIAFSGWLGNSYLSKIYEIDINSLFIKNLVENFYECISPSYSCDGRYLVYSSFRSQNDKFLFGGPNYNSGIYIKDLNNNQEIVIAEPKYINSFPIFSYDSKKIAFLSRRRDTNNDGIVGSLDNDAIYIFDLEKKKEYCVHSDKYYNKFVNFTYDNKYVVFLSTWHNKYKKLANDYFEFKGIYLCDIKGKHLKQVVSDKYYGCSCPHVSPKKHEVVYTSFRQDTLRGLYIADLFNLPSKEMIKDLIKNNI